MFRKLMATELIVRDLATCTAFYRDTLGLQVRESESTPNSVSFQMDNVHFSCWRQLEPQRWSVHSRLTSREREALACCWPLGWRMSMPPTRS